MEFERCGNVTLPQAYRMFLKEVGDGCGRMIDGFRLNRLRNMRCQDLARPFMPEEAWIWDYPEEWMEEADQIDAWVAAHEDSLYGWEKKLLSYNREQICR